MNPHWLSKDKDSHSHHTQPSFWDFSFWILLEFLLLPAVMNEDVSLSTLKNYCPKKDHPVFFLIFLKIPGLFRLELKHKSSSKAECTSFKSSQQGTASQGHTASVLPEPGSSAADCFPEATSLPGSISREAQHIWTADILVSELPTQRQGMHNRSIAVLPSLLMSGIHSGKCVPLGSQIESYKWW